MFRARRLTSSFSCHQTPHRKTQSAAVSLRSAYWIASIVLGKNRTLCKDEGNLVLQLPSESYLSQNVRTLFSTISFHAFFIMPSLFRHLFHSFEHRVDLKFNFFTTRASRGFCYTGHKTPALCVSRAENANSHCDFRIWRVWIALSLCVEDPILLDPNNL